MGGQIRRALLSGQISLDDAWEKVADLHRTAWVPFLLYGVQDTLKSKLLDAGSEPIIEYRQDQPPASLTDWQNADEDLRRFLLLEPRIMGAGARELSCEVLILRLRSRFSRRGRQTLNPKLLS